MSALTSEVNCASARRPVSITSSWWITWVPFARGLQHARGHVGDEREAEDLDAHVARDDDLVHGGHADEVGAEGAEGADLGGRLVAGAEDGEVDAFGQRDVLLCGLFGGEFAQARRVGGGHVEEAQAGAGADGEARLVGADGGVLAGEVDVVGDADEAALRVGLVDAAGGVGDDERLAAEQAEHAHGEGDLGHCVAFVGVHAALHDGDGDAADGADDELALVAFDGGAREVRDLGVGDDDGVLDLRGEAAEAGAEDDAERGLEVGLEEDVGEGLRDAGVEIGRVVLIRLWILRSVALSSRRLYEASVICGATGSLSWSSWLRGVCRQSAGRRGVCRGSRRRG